MSLGRVAVRHQIAMNRLSQCPEDMRELLGITLNSGHFYLQGTAVLPGCNGEPVPVDVPFVQEKPEIHTF